jgi:hypothetical protein
MLLFKDSKSGYPAYMLDKEALRVSEGRIVNVGQPYIEPQKPGQLAPSMQRLVDVTIEADGKTQTFVIPEMLSVTYAGHLVISLERDDILREVKALRQQSVSAIDALPRHKETLSRCDAILAELDVEFKEKRERDSRLDRLESRISTMCEDMASLTQALKKMTL